ncbi:hypothetical protein AAE478_003761 [Parahypoxylon ruwenzoriense]
MPMRLEHSAILLGFRHDDEFDPDGAVTIRAVRVMLRENIPNLSAIVGQRIKESFAVLLDAPLQQKGVMKASVLAFAKMALVQPCIQISYGDELGMYCQASCATEALAKSLGEDHLGRMFMAWRGSMREVGKHLEMLIKERLAAHANGSDEQYLDLARFVIASSRAPEQKDPVRLRQLLIAMAFTFAHQPPMALAWAIIELGQHHEYIELLRSEICTVEQEGHADLINHLPLMESVLRESSRLHPLDGLTVQRKAVNPFSFSYGIHLPVGTLVAVPQQAILRDPANYSDPDQFNPFRFHPYSAPGQAVRKWTDVDPQYLFWGSLAKPCPGRWMASHLLKQFLVQFLKNYDFELLDPNNCKSATQAMNLIGDMTCLDSIFSGCSEVFQEVQTYFAE